MTTPSRRTFPRGSVVLVPFPFTDLSASKNRPAVVLTTERHSRGTSDLMIVQITSNVQRRALGDYLINDWQAAGLRMESVARARVATLRDDLVVHVLGQLSATDLAGVEHCLRTALGL